MRNLQGSPVVKPALFTRFPALHLKEADILVMQNEVSDHHEGAVLVRRLFGNGNAILCIYAEARYGDQKFGMATARLCHSGASRADSYMAVHEVLNGNCVRRIVCMPYMPGELMTAIALKDMHQGARLCLILTEDNNIQKQGINDELMEEALWKADLRLAGSPEMRDAYERKYGYKFFVLPPLTQDTDHYSRHQHYPSDQVLINKTGVLIGHVRSGNWLAMLRSCVRGAGLTVHWYGSDPKDVEPALLSALAQDGIVCKAYLPEERLVEQLIQYAYALIPSGTMDAQDDCPEIARLSLPGCMPFFMASANLPMIVLGSDETSAAHFVRRFSVGVVAPYDVASLQQAVNAICEPDRQLSFRRSAAEHCGLFSNKDAEAWLWKALDCGYPPDDRYEKAFKRDLGETIPYIHPPAPIDVYRGFHDIYHALGRIRSHGYTPDFVIDVGASTGIWSDTVKRLYPKARFIVVDPLIETYISSTGGYFYKKNVDFERVAMALSDEPGEVSFQVSEDLYGSSLLHPDDHRVYHKVTVPVTTLDGLGIEKAIHGRGLLKVDVQCAEHMVLAGANTFIKQIDVLILELSLVRYAPEAKLFLEMCNLAESMGFRYYDDVGCWRCTTTGDLLQKDVLFVRNDSFFGIEANLD